ncbi:hypothetical protein [Lutibacter sp.]|uniref:HYC_CC_PP family protein n=1 Tax=Lutibacter sp. TaxID=1925666 RepID=UPI0034A01EBC
MKGLFRKIAAVLMVTILLLSTTSFSIYKHFCGDNLVAISTEKVDNCCDSKTTLKSNNLNFSKKDCCKNETALKNIQLFDTTSSKKIAKSQTLFLASFYFSFIEKLITVDTTIKFYKDFSPPTLVSNKQVLFQTFLI